MATADKGIRQLGPDRWEVRVNVGRDPDTGKLRQVSRSTRKGIADARKLRARLITEVAEGKHGGIAGTLGSLLDAWLAHIERDGRSPSTLAEYRRKIDRTIRPALGSRPLDKLSAHDLDAFYAALRATGTDPATIIAYHRIIGAALATAERWGWVNRNVTKSARPPAVHRERPVVPPPERVRQLIDRAARSRNPELAAVVTLAALTGLRRGELAGLRWSDVEWDEQAITVRRSIWQTRTGHGVKAPKSHQVRRLLLGEHAMAVLAGRWGRVRTAAETAEVALSPDAYVFSPDLDGDRPMLPDALTQAFSRICRQMERPALDALRTTHPSATRADLPAAERWDYHLHSLRHYTATELFRAGHHARTVADRLGHADPALTLRVYTADTPDQARAAADALEAGLAPPALDE